LSKNFFHKIQSSVFPRGKTLTNSAQNLGNFKKVLPKNSTLFLEHYNHVKIRIIITKKKPLFFKEIIKKSFLKKKKFKSLERHFVDLKGKTENKGE